MKMIILAAVMLLLIGCSDDSSSSSVKQEIVKEPVESVKAVEAEVVVQEIKEPAVEVPPVAVEIVDEKDQIVLAETTVTTSGADLFKACASCHGLNGEKKALNKSKVIQGWSKVQVSTALNGYKDGSYGGAMKGLMKAQVTKLSDEDVGILAKYISEL